MCKCVCARLCVCARSLWASVHLTDLLGESGGALVTEEDTAVKQQRRTQRSHNRGGLCGHTTEEDTAVTQQGSAEGMAFNHMPGIQPIPMVDASMALPTPLRQGDLHPNPCPARGATPPRAPCAGGLTRPWRILMPATRSWAAACKPVTSSGWRCRAWTRQGGCWRSRTASTMLPWTSWR